MGIEVVDTKAETLAALDHPVIKSFVRFRQTEKQTQMLRKLLGAIETDGRIHAEFKPTGADTGRFSSSGPNLQNVSRGQTRSYASSPGLAASFSWLPIIHKSNSRAAAALAGEPKMLDAFRQGADLHMRTAELVLGRTPTTGDRQLAKASNFGLLYGLGAKGLEAFCVNQSYGVEMTYEQASEIRKNFFAGYEGAFALGMKLYGLRCGGGCPRRPCTSTLVAAGCSMMPATANGSGSLPWSIPRFKAVVLTV